MKLSTDTRASAPVGADAPDTGEATAGAGRRFGMLWLVGTLIIGVLLGLSTGLLLPRLNQPGDDSVEAGFLRDMASHHAQAVEMGMIAHAAATDPEVAFLGEDIALTQHGQINIMQTWLRDWGLDITGSQPRMSWMPDGAASIRDGLMPGMATPEEMTALRSATGKNVDVQFLELMRRHHLGGIHMAQAIVQLSDHEPVTELAEGMITAQQGEINLIDDLLKRVRPAA